ncbi:MAG TPA: outer membrane beta-barrel protein [Salegentibacter sp.]|uniref:outer membrane beta-barrel protein n=1 Tax=Salegentibacter sp. TaxID=1903072 RepID=UPI002F91CB26
MNKSFLPILIGLLCFSLSSNAQEYSFGVKGGGNYVMGGSITGKDPGGVGYFDGTIEADPEFGFHAGVFFQLKFGKFFIRPEAMYHTMSTTFEFPTQPSAYEVDKISIPLLFGYNIWGPIDIYAGPAYQNIMNSSLEGTEPPDKVIVVQNTPLAAQAGVKVNFGRFEVDLRYDRTLASKELQFVDIDNGEYGVNDADFTDSRLNQVLLSIGFKIGDSESNPGRRRGKGCYF